MSPFLPDANTLQRAPERAIFYVLAGCLQCAHRVILVEHPELYELPPEDGCLHVPTIAARQLSRAIEALVESLALYEASLVAAAAANDDFPF
jgi:hypothetical protein